MTTTLSLSMIEYAGLRWPLRIVYVYE